MNLDNGSDDEGRRALSSEEELEMLFELCAILKRLDVHVRTAHFGWRDCRIFVEGVGPLTWLLLFYERVLPSYLDIRFDYTEYANRRGNDGDTSRFPVVLVVPTRDLADYIDAFTVC